MATIHYFASIREKLGLSAEQVELPSQVDTVSALVELLIKQHEKDDKEFNSSWGDVLNNTAVLVAVNQTVAKFSSSIKDSDEIAFFPPVTGG
ncbi:MAG: molybdopterin converting factor subunit 1 [Gammaproteobacteria bacterium]|jgi:sulfur-carrier protein|nr:molybdopterin converting factor subunit 1 [Gammaproteobacteria bacterium]